MKDKVRKKNDQINIEMGIESPLLEEAILNSSHYSRNE